MSTGDTLGGASSNDATLSPSKAGVSIQLQKFRSLMSNLQTGDMLQVPIMKRIAICTQQTSRLYATLVSDCRSDESIAAALESVLELIHQWNGAEVDPASLATLPITFGHLLLKTFAQPTVPTNIRDGLLQLANVSSLARWTVIDDWSEPFVTANIRTTLCILRAVQPLLDEQLLSIRLLSISNNLRSLLSSTSRLPPLATQLELVKLWETFPKTCPDLAATRKYVIARWITLLPMTSEDPGIKKARQTIQKWIVSTLPKSTVSSFANSIAAMANGAVTNSTAPTAAIDSSSTSAPPMPVNSSISLYTRPPDVKAGLDNLGNTCQLKPSEGADGG